MKKLKILVIFDSAGMPPDNQDFTEEFKLEEWQVESRIVKTLKTLGHNVRTLGVYDDIGLIVKELKENVPDIAFNLTEVFHGKAYFDKNMPAIFEVMDVFYTGCGPVGLMMCNNKALAKKILTYHRIKVPNFHIFNKNKRIWHPKKLKFPIMVKPLQEEASTGIAQASFVENDQDLAERVRFIHQKFDMAALAEEYIDGRELYVSILGNDRLQVLPLREMKFTQVPETDPKLATYKAKWDKGYRKKWGIKNEFPGKLPSGIIDKIAHVCKKAYRALLIEGYGRFDIRLTSKGEIFIIEANGNPSMGIDDEVAESAKKLGISYDKLLQRIISLAFKRKHK